MFWANLAGVKTSVGSRGKAEEEQTLAHLQQCMKTGWCVHSEEEMDGDKAAMQMGGDGGMEEDGCQAGGMGRVFNSHFTWSHSARRRAQWLKWLWGASQFYMQIAATHLASGAGLLKLTYANLMERLRAYCPRASVRARVFTCTSWLFNFRGAPSEQQRWYRGGGGGGKERWRKSRWKEKK